MSRRWRWRNGRAFSTGSRTGQVGPGAGRTARSGPARTGNEKRPAPLAITSQEAATTHSEQIMLSEFPQPRSIASIGGHPIHPMLVPFPIVCFVGAFATDLVYWRSMSFIWATFSVWLLTAGLIMAAFAAIVGLVDFAANRRIREFRPAWYHLLGNALVIVLSVINVFVHSRDGYTAVVPTGLILSGLVVLILMATAWMGREMVYRGRVGVAD
jgi:uncharacterized membrane protein